MPQKNYKKEKFILLHDFRGFCPHCFGPGAAQYIMVSAHGRGGQKAKRKTERGGSQYPFRATPPIT
jgi:hypothetical protein